MWQKKTWVEREKGARWNKLINIWTVYLDYEILYSILARRQVPHYTHPPPLSPNKSSKQVAHNFSVGFCGKYYLSTLLLMYESLSFPCKYESCWIADTEVPEVTFVLSLLYTHYVLWYYTHAIHMILHTHYIWYFTHIVYDLTHTLRILLLLHTH